jgi:hypothetical protein
MSELHVITTVSNPLGYRSRYQLYREFEARMASQGARLYTVELALPDQPFAVTNQHQPRHIQIRSPHLLWYKENLVNIALNYLPRDWEYAAWVDADIAFVRPDWVAATLQQLEQHAFVQLFTHALDLGPQFEPIKTYEGFVYRLQQSPGQGGNPGQTGYAWAARRVALEAIGGVLDWSILGSNDYYMALALIGAIRPEMTRMPDSGYSKSLLEWQARIAALDLGEPGCVANSLLHFWHGKRADRGYDTRWKILLEHHFDPAADLHRDEQGLLQLRQTKPELQAAIKQYFRNRDEDNPNL